MGIGVFVQQGVQLPTDILVGRSQLLRRPWTRQRQRGGRAAAETDVGGDLALFQQGDVFDQECQHPLALALRRVRVAPHRREVGGQGWSVMDQVLGRLLEINHVDLKEAYQGKVARPADAGR